MEMGKRNKGGGRGGGGGGGGGRGGGNQLYNFNSQGGNRQNNNRGGYDNRGGNSNQGGYDNRGSYNNQGGYDNQRGNNNRGGRNNDFNNRGGRGNNSRGDRHNNNRNNQGRNDGQNRFGDNQGNQRGYQNRSRCSRCEKNGHNAASCTAKEIPEQSRCECGNPFHYPNQCPYSNDPDERQESLAVETGFLCTWCKDTSDGKHTFDNCEHARKFKRDLMQSLRYTYNILQWCWHCSSTDHREYACKGTQATLDVELWTTRVNEVMEEWKNYTHVDFLSAYPEYQLDVAMENFEHRMVPPIAANYKWCMKCEVFGHATNNKIGGCDTAKWESREPKRLASTKPSHPWQPKPQGLPHPFFSQSTPPRIQTMTPCVTPTCTNKIGPWTYPIPPFGEAFMCPVCLVNNYHPHTLGRHISQNSSLNQQPSARSPKSKLPANILEAYSKRPSLKLNYTLRPNATLSALTPNGIATFTYPDLDSRHPNISPTFFNSGQYFSNAHPYGSPHFAWGNFQEYFPAITFVITSSMWAESRDPSLPINRAGQQGLEAQCSGCQCEVLVLDNERDVVMCGTEWTNTVGEGTGYGVYVGGNGRMVTQCNCLTIFGQRGEPIWKDWRDWRRARGVY